MLKGAKKAVIRAPHRFLGSKSIEDKVIIEWSKDFVTAEEALSQIIRETKTFISNWRDLCKSQKEIALTLRTIYEPIKDDNQYRPVQETPQSSLTAVAQYGEYIGDEFKSTIEPHLAYLEGPFLNKLREARECMKAVQKILTKREHKKMDFDRHSNSLEKMLKRRHSGGEAMSEKEQLAITKEEQELDAATEIFHEIDEKVKSTIPFILTSMSEFLNPMTSTLYMTQLKVFESAQFLLAKYGQQYGLAGSLAPIAINTQTDVLDGSLSYQTTTKKEEREGSIVSDTASQATNGEEENETSHKPISIPILTFTGEPEEYYDIMNSWENSFLTVQPRCEQGLATIREGSVVKIPMGESRKTIKDQAAQQINKITKRTVSLGVEATSGLAHRAVGKRPKKYVDNIQFSSAEKGFFNNEADLLSMASFLENEGLNSPPPGGYSVLNRSSSDSSSPRQSTSPTTGNMSSAMSGAFSFFSKKPMLSDTNSRNSRSRVSSLGGLNNANTATTVNGTYGRSPVTSLKFTSGTSNFNNNNNKSIHSYHHHHNVLLSPQEDRESKEALRTRVRAALSTAAWTLGEDDKTRESISGRLRSNSMRSYGYASGEESNNNSNSNLAKSNTDSKEKHRRLTDGNERAVALYTFNGAEPGDVSFRVGEEIKVLDHGDEDDDQWWFGQTADGRVGLFPCNYVKVL